MSEPRLLLFKSDVKGHMRGGKFVSAYDRTPGVSGKQHAVPVRGSVYQWSGIPMNVIYADYVRLHAKHPEYFADAASAMHHVEWVLEHPHIFLPATDTRYVMFIRRGSVDKCVVVDPNVKHGSKGYSVRSAFILDKGQVDKYVKYARQAGADVLFRKSLSAGSLSPGVLGSLKVGSRGFEARQSSSMFPRSLPMPHGMVQLSSVKFSPDFLSGGE